MEQFGRIVGKPLDPPSGKLKARLILKYGEKGKEVCEVFEVCEV